MENQYWNLFMKSGKIGDYLTFCKERKAQDAAFSFGKEEKDETNHKGTHPKRTEYR